MDTYQITKDVIQNVLLLDLYAKDSNAFLAHLYVILAKLHNSIAFLAIQAHLILIFIKIDAFPYVLMDFMSKLQLLNANLVPNPAKFVHQQVLTHVSAVFLIFTFMVLHAYNLAHLHIILISINVLLVFHLVCNVVVNQYALVVLEVNIYMVLDV